MRRLFACLVLVLTPCSGLFTAHAQIDPSTLAVRLESALAPVTETRDFSGVIAFRIGDGPIQLVSLGYADWQSGARFSGETRFPAGAITRTLTRAMADRMLEAGTLHPDTPLSRYLPDLAGAEALAVGDLLDRTGRIDPAAAARTAWQPDAAAQASPIELDEAALARVIEIARNARFETLIASRFLGPLDMDSSLILDRHAGLNGLATGYTPGPRPLDLRPASDPVVLPGHDGLYATAPDLVRLGQAVLERRIDLFQADGRMRAGWEAGQREGYAHYAISAAPSVYRTGIIALSPGEFVLAYAVNIESYPAEAVHALILDLIFNADVDLPVRPATVALDPSLLQAAGRYHSAVLGSLEIVQGEGGLDIILPQSGRRDYLTPAGPDRLFWRRIGTELVLERDESGRVVRLTGRRLTDAAGRAITLERTDLPPLEAEPAD